MLYCTRARRREAGDGCAALPEEKLELRPLAFLLTLKRIFE